MQDRGGVLGSRRSTRTCNVGLERSYSAWEGNGVIISAAAAANSHTSAAAAAAATAATAAATAAVSRCWLSTFVGGDVFATSLWLENIA